MRSAPGFFPDHADAQGAQYNRLNREIVHVLNASEAREKFMNLGMEPVTNSPEQFAAAIKVEMSRMGRVIKDAGIRAE